MRRTLDSTQLPPEPIAPLPLLLTDWAEALADPAQAIQAWLPGNPVAQPRPRAGIMGARRDRLCVYQAPSGHPVYLWKAQVALALKVRRPKEPLEGPILLALDGRAPAPDSLVRSPKKSPRLAKTWMDVKPDIDNLAKAVLDAGNGLWWRDDSQVVALIQTKRYASPWHPRGPGVLLTALPLDQAPIYPTEGPAQ